MDPEVAGTRTFIVQAEQPVIWLVIHDKGDGDTLLRKLSCAKATVESRPMGYCGGPKMLSIEVVVENGCEDPGCVDKT